jgi:CRP-like cAMP-binding protein
LKIENPLDSFQTDLQVGQIYWINGLNYLTVVESLKISVMTSMSNLKNFVSKYVSLTEEEFEYFESFFEIRHFKKKELLIREGEVEKYINYIDTGSARLFFLKGKEEIVMEFAIENELIFLKYALSFFNRSYGAIDRFFTHA